MIKSTRIFTAGTAALLLVIGCTVPSASSGGGSSSATAAETGPGTLSFSWKASEADKDAPFFHLSVKDKDGTVVHFEKVPGSRGAGGQFDVPVKPPAGDYSAEIVAEKSDGSPGGAYRTAGPATVKSQAARPSNPGNLKVAGYEFSAAETYEATLSWTEPTDFGNDVAGGNGTLSQYTIYYAEGSTVSLAGAQVDAGTSLSASVPNLKIGKAYAFMATASNKDVGSLGGETVRAPKLLFDLTVDAQKAGEDTIKADWTPKGWTVSENPALAGFRVEITKDGESTPSYAKELGKDARTHTTAALESGSYSAAVIAVRNGVDAAPSAAAGSFEIRSKATAPTAPTLKTIPAGTIPKPAEGAGEWTATAKLSWDAPSSAGEDANGNPLNVREYILSYAPGESASGTGAESLTVTGRTAAEIPGLKLNTKYAFEVKAVNTGGLAGPASNAQTMAAVASKAQKPSAPDKPVLGGYKFTQAGDAYSATVSWSGLAADQYGKLPDGSAPKAISYTVYHAKGAAASATVHDQSFKVAAGTSQKLDSLETSSAHAVVVTASNGVETSEASSILEQPALQFGLKNVRVSATGTTVTVAWERDGWEQSANPAFKGYRVRILDGTGNAVQSELLENPSKLEYEATLTVGSYTADAAVVRIDDSETAPVKAKETLSVTSKATAPGKPGLTEKPTAAYAGGGANWTATATVKWTKPADTGKKADGSTKTAITGYVVYYAEGESVSRSSQKRTVADPSAAEATITGLALGRKYTFMVRAKNAEAGEGTASEPQTMDALASQATAPDKPIGVSAASKAGSDGKVAATVKWTAPASSGKLANGDAADLSGYTVYYAEGDAVSVGAAAKVDADAADTEKTIPNLKLDTAYSFIVAAASSAGLSSGSDTITIPAAKSGARAPGKPVIETPIATAAADADKMTATIQWSVPDPGKNHNGGAAAITGYTVHYAKGPSVGESDASMPVTPPTTGTPTATVEDLDRATYTFMVTARNSAGIKSLSDDAPARAPNSQAAAPGKATRLTLTEDASGAQLKITVGWTAPVDPGKAFNGSDKAAISGYRVYYAPGNAVSAASDFRAAGAAAASIEITGIDKDEAYVVMVMTINSEGMRSESEIKTRPALLYKPDFPAQADQGRFSLGDFDSGRLFLVKGLPAGEASAEIVIKEADARKFPATGTSAATLTVPANGELHFGISGMTYAQWAGLNDQEHAIEVTLTKGSDQLIKTTFTVAKTPEGSIYTWRDLQGMKHNLKGSYVLQNDISFPKPDTKGFPKNGFKPVGTSSSVPFTGSLDGGNKTITDLYINHVNEKGEKQDGAGLFGYAEAKGSNLVFKDLKLIDPTVIGASYTGTFFGVLSAYYHTDSAKAFNLHAERETGTMVSGTTYVGGLAGQAAGRSALLHGTVSGAVTASDVVVGGLAGGIDLSSRLRGVATGSVSGKGFVGGLTGTAYAAINDKASNGVLGIATGKVSGNDNKTGGLLGKGDAGNASGYWDKTSTGQATSAGGGQIVSAIANVVYSAGTGKYMDTQGTDEATDDVEVFNDTEFIKYFNLPGASGKWPALKPELPAETR